MKTFADSETGFLRTVLMGHIIRFTPEIPVNRVQHHYYRQAPPRKPLILEQYENFAAVLQERGVTVLRYDPAPDNLNRPFARDAFAVIGGRIFALAMKNRPGPVLENLWKDIKQTAVPVGKGILEGGDIVLDGNTVFVGRGERSDADGVNGLADLLAGRSEIISVYLKPGILHLDVVFNPVGKNLALIYPQGIQEESLKKLGRRYRFVPVTAEEQFALAVNVFSLSPEAVISQKGMDRVNDVLRKEGIEVIEVDYSEVVKLGGGFRCSTVPLVRDPRNVFPTPSSSPVFNHNLSPQ